jgi:colanic acid biosynthesis glycosyl transferase WcaI
MRLLVVSQYFWPENFRINEIVTEMVAKGHHVTVLTGRPNYPEGHIDPEFAAHPYRFGEFGGAEVIRVPLRPRGQGSLRLVLNYWSFVFWGCTLGPWLLKGRRFDSIFVFETSPITAALPAVLMKWLTGARLVMWVLDLWPDTLSAIGVVRSKRVLGWVGKLCRFIYKHCDLILGQSPAFAAPIEKWSQAPEKFRYLPNWVEGTFDSAPTGPVAPELSAFQGRFRVMFAGNLGEAQDLSTVLDAASRVRLLKPKVCWVLLGDGRAADKLRQEIVDLKLQDTVFLLGRHAQERMPSFFAGADALLVSLKPEPIFAMTIPGKIQSYLAAGKPILAMLDGVGAQVVKDAGAGVVCRASDAQALAANCVLLAEQSMSSRTEMGRAGMKFSERHFSREVVLNNLATWLFPASAEDTSSSSSPLR